MMTSLQAVLSTWVLTQAVGGKNELPLQFAICVRILAVQSVRKPYLSVTLRNIAGVQPFHTLNLLHEPIFDARGRDRAVFFSFAIADDDLPTFEIQVLDAESTAFHQPHSGAIE